MRERERETQEKTTATPSSTPATPSSTSAAEVVQPRVGSISVVVSSLVSGQLSSDSPDFGILHRFRLFGFWFDLVSDNSVQLGMNRSSQSQFGFHSWFRFSFGRYGFGSVSVRSTSVKPVRFMFFKARVILRFSPVQFVSVQSTSHNSQLGQRKSTGQLLVNDPSETWATSMFHSPNHINSSYLDNRKT
ncbi:uncharacterized protein LOC118483260 [Helianthus annuus]|nr:uncharacterized protein LOC118483260 [Helianthus annuus]